MNERTHFFIKIKISHFILERADVSVVCVRDNWRQGQTAIHDPSSSLNHSTLCYRQETS